MTLLLRWESFTHGFGCGLRVPLLSLMMVLVHVQMLGATSMPFAQRWPHGIVPIKNSHPNAAQDLWEAISRIEAATPVRFINHTVEEDYVEVVEGDDNVVRNAAWAHNTSDVIGFCKGRSEVHLKNGSGWLVLHELGHVLGLVHEHQRADRDHYVDVLWDNIADPEPGSVNWVKLSDSVSQGLSYDPNSVMHYGSDWQSIRGARSLKWLGSSGAAGNCIHYDCIPQVDWSHLSSNDAKAITLLYESEAVARNHLWSYSV